jgi:hypothetical protein
MKEKTLSMLLIFSILLNICFLAGYWFAHSRSKALNSRQQLINAVAEELDLTEKQRELFRRLRARAVTLRKGYVHTMEILGGQLRATLDSNSTGGGRRHEIIREMSSVREKYQQELIAVIVEFLDCLDSKQKEKFLEITGKNKVLSRLLAG